MHGGVSLFKIGEFSKLSHVTLKTIRYYDDDEIGLLKPAAIDPKTNYRYYSAQQLPRLIRIRREIPVFSGARAPASSPWKNR